MPKTLYSIALFFDALVQELVSGGTEGTSPHTLPFWDLKTYEKQLQLLGNHKKAATVRKFMNTLPSNDSRL